MTSTSEPSAGAPAPDPDLDRIIRQYDERQRRRAELRPANKAAVFDALAAAGIVTVTVSFDGYGDSGQIEDIGTRGAGGDVDLPSTEVALAVARYDEDDPERRQMPLARAIEEIAFDALADLHGGWENNDGAYGEFVFDVEKRAISLDYHERYTATKDFSHEL